jgi:hypothetical protein
MRQHQSRVRVDLATFGGGLLRRREHRLERGRTAVGSGRPGPRDGAPLRRLLRRSSRPSLCRTSGRHAGGTGHLRAGVRVRHIAHQRLEDGILQRRGAVTFEQPRQGCGDGEPDIGRLADRDRRSGCWPAVRSVANRLLQRYPRARHNRLRTELTRPVITGAAAPSVSKYDPWLCQFSSSRRRQSLLHVR